ncbi:hypothetical protein pb186bvf_005041 [Paramecium bursaria]
MTDLCMEILKQGRRISSFMVEEIRTLFFESLYQKDRQKQSLFLSQQLQKQFGYNWMVFMIDEFNHDANIKYYNNNDLVLHFKSLGWNILIYGIDNQWW